MQKCKYVLVPADLERPIQQLEIELPEGQEVEYFLDVLKKHFAVAGGGSTEKQRAAKKEALMKQCGDANLSSEMWDAALSMNTVENIALLSNSPDTGYVAVNMYCDDEGSFKELPLNLRASDIARCCGKLMEVRGDVFLGRIFDNEDSFKRLDFTASEVSSSAQWVAEAAAQTRRRESRESAHSVMERMSTAQRSGPKPKVEEVVEQSPADMEREKGNQMFRKGKWVEAIEHYSAAIKLDATMVAAINNRAMAYLKLEQYDAVVRDCEAVLALDSSNVKAMFRRACACLAGGEREAAVNDLKRVLELQPQNKEAEQKLKEIEGS